MFCIDNYYFMMLSDRYNIIIQTNWWLSQPKKMIISPINTFGYDNHKMYIDIRSIILVTKMYRQLLGMAIVAILSV